MEKGLACPSLLATYGEERLPVIAAMLQKSTLLFDAMHKSQNIGFKRGNELRQLGVNYRWSSIVVDERTPKPKSAAEVNPYGSGDNNSLRAGDRAPQAPGLIRVGATSGPSETSLFDTFGPDHHTVLLFNAPADEAERAVGAAKQYPAGIVKTVAIVPQGASEPGVAGQLDVAVIDKDGYAFSAYQVSPAKPTIVIVRPDGVVGGIVYGLEGLKTYFGGVFNAVSGSA